MGDSKLSSTMRWRNVFGFALVLVILAATAVYFFSPPGAAGRIDASENAIESSNVEIAARSYGASYQNTSSNDISVLRAVLENYCSKHGNNLSYILSSTPANTFDDGMDYEGVLAEAKLHMNLRDAKFNRGPRESMLDMRTVRKRLPDELECPGIGIMDEKKIADSLETGYVIAEKERDYASSYFRHAFPGVNGIVRLGFPGYSRDGASAMVYVAVFCGRLCGSGFTIQLHKSNGVWKIVGRRSIWIS